MSTRKLGLLTTTAVLALTASIGTAGAALAAPPPSPPDTDSSSATPEAAPDAQNAPEVAPESAPENAPNVPSANAGAPAKPAGKPAVKPAVKPAGKPVAKKSAAKDGTNLHACMDASCEVEVRDGQEIKIDPRYGIDQVDIDVDGSRAIFTVRREYSKSISSVNATNPFSTTSYNGVTLSPRMTEDGKVILKISRT